jgi:hypothetical protein
MVFSCASGFPQTPFPWTVWYGWYTIQPGSHRLGKMPEYRFGYLKSMNAVWSTVRSVIKIRKSYEIRHLQGLITDIPRRILVNSQCRYLIKIFFCILLELLWDHFLTWDDFRSLRSIVRGETFGSLSLICRLAWNFETFGPTGCN